MRARNSQALSRDIVQGAKRLCDGKRLVADGLREALVFLPASDRRVEGLSGGLPQRVAWCDQQRRRRAAHLRTLYEYLPTRGKRWRQ